MDDNTLNWISGFATFIIAALAFFDEIRKAKNNFATIFKISTLIMCSIGIIWATNKRDSNADQRTVRDKLIDQIEQNKRDSIISANEHYRDSVSHEEQKSDRDSIITSLARYGLKFDSATNTITKVIREDTSKRNVNIYHGKDPTVSICIKDDFTNTPQGLELEKVPGTDSLRLKIAICYENGPENLTLAFLIISYKDGKFNYDGGKELFYKKRMNISNGSINQQISYDLLGNVDGYKIYIYFIGSYTTRDGSKSFPIDVIYTLHQDDLTYTINPDKLLQPENDMDEKIRAFIAKIK